MFDYAKIEDGRIVERIQQSDTLSQLRQMYSGAARKAGLAAAAGLLGAVLLASGRRGGRGKPAGRGGNPPRPGPDATLAPWTS